MPPVDGTMEIPAKEIEIPMPWGVIKGKWWGKEKTQPLLAIHGWQDNAGSFDNLAPLLIHETSVLCIDLPGHGFSSHYPKGMTYYIFWDTLILIRRIVQYYKWDKVSIIGHSLGGAAGFLYAAVFPDQVDKLISIDIVCPRVARPDIIVKQVSDCIDKFLTYETMNESSDVPTYEYNEMVETALQGHKGSITRDSCETLMKRGMVPVGENSGKYKFSRDVRLKVAGLAMFSEEEVITYASKIKCDYLNIRAKPGIKFEIPELYNKCLDKIKESAKKFEFHEIPGTHHIHLNDAKAISGIISDFLSGKESNNVSSGYELDDFPV